MQGLVRAAPDGIDLSGAAKTGPQTRTASLNQNQYYKQDDADNRYPVPKNHLKCPPAL